MTCPQKLRIRDLHHDTRGKAMPQLIVGCVAALLPILVCLGYAVQSEKSGIVPGFGGRAAESQRKEVSPDPMCGPRSVWVAAARLGVPVDLPELVEACGVTTEGAPMLDLKRGAEVFGLRAQGVRLSWEELVRLETPAVLFVSGDHFCCVDPREKGKGENAGKVRFYDPPKPAVWKSREQLQWIWRGEALLIRWPVEPETIPGPRARFDTLLTDFGTLDADSVTSYKYGFRNIGSQPLEIKEIEKSCGCTSAVVTKRILAPGKDASVVLTLDLHGRQGPQSHTTQLITNDPLTSSIILVCQGVAWRPVRVSTQLVDFGEVLPGQSVKREVTVVDRGDGTLRVKRAEVVFDSVRLTASEEKATTSQVLESVQPKVSVHWDAYGARVVEHYVLAFPARMVETEVGDGPLSYRFALEAVVPADAPQAVFEGSFRVATDDPRKPEILVPVRLEVVGDYYVSPSKVFFGIAKSGATITRTVVLQSRSGRPVRLVECRARQEKAETSGVSPTMKVIQEKGGKAIVELSLFLPEKPPTPGSNILKGEVELYPAEASWLGVKWLCIPKY